MPRLNSRQLSIVKRDLIFAYVSFPYSDAMIADLKRFPGCRYAPEVGKTVWAIPLELYPVIQGVARDHGLSVFALPPEATRQAVAPPINPKLFSFQVEAVERALAGMNLLINFEMGLGKTPTAIESLRLLHAKQPLSAILIVCPAAVRLTWQDEIAKWWPGSPDSLVVDTGVVGDEWEPDIAPIVITSYELLKDRKKAGLRPSFDRRFDAIVVDEAHSISNKKAGRSKLVRQLLDHNPGSLRLMLTATPITNQPLNLHFQLDSLWPRRFGGYWGFAKRYAIHNAENAYTQWDYSGLNPETAAELNERLKAVSVRATRKEVAHLLPPFTIQPVRVKAPRGFDPRALLEKFQRMDLHNNKPGEDLIRAAGQVKVEAALEQTRLAMAAGTAHTCVLTYHRDTAHEIAEALRSEFRVTCVTGEHTPKVRSEMIAACKAQPASVLVATMSSVLEGINLGFIPIVTYAELSYSARDMIQSTGRFSGFRAQAPTTIYMLVLEGTQDELIASRVQKKIENINQVIRAGQSEGAIEHALSVPEESDEDFMASMRSAIGAVTETSEYI